MTARNSVPLRGRDAELARIKRRLQEVAAGVGAVIVIEGRAGLGKTRLLEECAALAAEMSFRVGQGTEEPGRSVVELEALLNALFGGDKPLLTRTSLHNLQVSAEQTFWLLQDIQSLIEGAALKDRLAICLDEGCRSARPGEFTLRAFLNGRLDLSQAEAVIDVVRARTNLSLEMAVQQLSVGPGATGSAGP